MNTNLIALIYFRPHTHTDIDTQITYIYYNRCCVCNTLLLPLAASHLITVTTANAEHYLGWRKPREISAWRALIQNIGPLVLRSGLVNDTAVALRSLVRWNCYYWTINNSSKVFLLCATQTDTKDFRSSIVAGVATLATP